MSTGAAATSKRLIAGSFTSAGSVARTSATRSRTWVAASEMSTPSLKITIVVDRLSRENERTRSMPLRLTTASSIFLVTCDSTSSGLAPG